MMTTEARGAQQAARGPALARRVRAGAAPPAGPGVRRLRRADLAARADGRAAAPTRRRPRTPSSGSPSRSATGSTGRRPVTATAVVSMAMLGEDRALSLAAGAGDGRAAGRLPRRARLAGGRRVRPHRRATTLRRTLQELVASGVLTSYDGGTETVWRIAPDQHLVAAFYRNTAIHVFVDRAIGELALLAAAESDAATSAPVAEAEALRLRELLKFDFFFSGRHEFGEDIDAELRTVGGRRPQPVGRRGRAASPARRRAAARRPPGAAAVPRRLPHRRRPARRLRRAPTSEAEFLDECLAVGRQWALQGRIASDESVTLELFKTALRLAAHRGLLDAGQPRPGQAARRTSPRRSRWRPARIDTIAELPPGRCAREAPTTSSTEIEAGPRGPHIAAFFDLDGTLVHGFTATHVLAPTRSASGQVGAGDLARLVADRRRRHPRR